MPKCTLKCTVCSKFGLDSNMIKCGGCKKLFHAVKCLGLDQQTAIVVRKQRTWRCPECKSCPVCQRKFPYQQSKYAVCKKCDQGYHWSCVRPRTRESKDNWICSNCSALRSSPFNNSSPIKVGVLPPKVSSPGRGMLTLHASPTHSPRNRLTSKIVEDRKRVNERLRNEPEIYLDLSPKLESKRPRLEHLTTSPDYDLFMKAQSIVKEKSPLENPSESSQIEWVRLGNFEIRVWYPSPYPDHLATCHELFVCEFCLKGLSSETIYRRHSAKCVWRHPPGNEIYRKDNISFWEVDGKYAKVYCQNLCLLAKLFLDHKTLYFDVEPFLFYVLTVIDSTGCHMVGYYSKEKQSLMNCNLSCLLTLPAYQRKGFGRLLIDFSYLLSRKEDRIGSPEHPLSDMGLLTYRNYWKDAILLYILKYEHRSHISIKDISLTTGIHPNDIVSTLQYLGMVKYWKGRYVIYKKPEILGEFRKKTKKTKEVIEIDEKRFHWKVREETEENGN